MTGVQTCALPILDPHRIHVIPCGSTRNTRGSVKTLEVQAQIPVLLAVLHNFICIHDPKEGPIFGSGSDHSTGDAEGQEDYVATVSQHGNSCEEMDEC